MLLLLLLLPLLLPLLRLGVAAPGPATGAADRGGRKLLGLGGLPWPGPFSKWGPGGAVDGLGSFSASNSFRLFGKIVNYALSLSYGDAPLPPWLGPGVGAFPPPPLPLPLPVPLPLPGVPVQAAAVAEPPPLPAASRLDLLDYEDGPAVEAAEAEGAEREPLSTPVPSGPGSGLGFREWFDRQRTRFLQRHGSAVEAFNRELQTRRRAAQATAAATVSPRPEPRAHSSATD